MPRWVETVVVVLQLCVAFVLISIRSDGGLKWLNCVKDFDALAKTLLIQRNWKSILHSDADLRQRC